MRPLLALLALLGPLVPLSSQDMDTSNHPVQELLQDILEELRARINNPILHSQFQAHRQIAMEAKGTVEVQEVRFS